MSFRNSMSWVFKMVIKHVHLVTVGAGIVNNYLRDNPSDLEFKRVCLNDKELFKRASEVFPVFQRVYSYLCKNPRRASPEVNAMWKYLERGLVNQVYLYHTDTGVGKFCAELLRKYFREEHNIETYVVKLEGFGLVFEEGLTSLLDKVVDKIRKLTLSPLVRVYLNATGGFKPENAILVLAASLMNVKTIYYMHEKFKEPIELPIFPLTIKEEYLKILKQINEYEKMHGFSIKIELIKKIGEAKLNELKERNLIVEENGRIKLRKWMKVMLKYYT